MMLMCGVMEAVEASSWQRLAEDTPPLMETVPTGPVFMDSSSSPGSSSSGSNATQCAEHILSYGPAEKVVIGGVLAVLTLSTVCGNLLVVTSVCFVKKLRQPSNYLIVSLALADLSVALAVMPFVSVTDLTGGRWLFGRLFCNVFIAMDVMCCTASIMTLCVISIDRYLGITKPLTYPVRQSGRRMSRMILCVWLLSASITLPPLFGWAHNVNDGQVCLISQDLGYTVYSTAVAFYIPTSVMLFMYHRIYRAAKHSAAKHTIISGFPREEGELEGGLEGGGGAGGEVEEEARQLGGRHGEIMEEEAEEEESLGCVSATLKLRQEVRIHRHHLPRSQNHLPHSQNHGHQLPRPQTDQDHLPHSQNHQHHLPNSQNHHPPSQNDLPHSQNQQHHLPHSQNHQDHLPHSQNHHPPSQNDLPHSQNQLPHPQKHHHLHLPHSSSHHLRPSHRRQRNQSIFKREQKAAATLGIVVGAFTFCWLPFFLVSAARPFVCGVECSCVPLWLERTLLWLGYANSLINPFVYAFFNRDLRTTYSNLLRCRYRNINRKLSAAGMHEALRLVEKPDSVL